MVYAQYHFHALQSFCEFYDCVLVMSRAKIAQVGSMFPETFQCLNAQHRNFILMSPVLNTRCVECGSGPQFWLRVCLCSILMPSLFQRIILRDYTALGRCGARDQMPCDSTLLLSHATCGPTTSLTRKRRSNRRFPFVHLQ